MTKLQKLSAIPLAAIVMLGGGAVAGYATLAGAQTAGSTTQSGTMPQRAPGVHGAISAINGTTLTVTDERSGTAYTVDASAASVKKFVEGSGPTTAALSDLAVGQKVSVRGTVSGTSIVATEITQGDFKGDFKKGDFKGPGKGGPHGGMGSGVQGTVSAVSGSTITVTGKDGQTYTVNAGSATVQHMVTGSLSDITVGDTIGVQGTVSGTSITATTIMDGIPTPSVQQ